MFSYSRAVCLVSYELESSQVRVEVKKEEEEEER